MTTVRNLELAHAHSAGHRSEILISGFCGCFHCLKTYSASAITKWVDAGFTGEWQTALCPKCGIDSVIGDLSGFDLSQEFLAAMNRR